MKERFLFVVCLLTGLLTGWGQQTPSNLKIAREFEARLAAEALPAGATAFDFDAGGRLWVVAPDAKSEFYTGPAKTSQVLVYEVRDGQVTAPQTFGNYLKPITSFVFYRDGIIAAQGPNIVWLRDKNQNGSVDVQELIYSGFGTNDPSGMVDNLRWGLDGWVYAAQNNRVVSGEIINKEGEKLGSVGCSVFRFRPDGKGVEKVAYSRGRISGLDIAWDGEVFFTQARSPHLQHIMMEECYLERGRLAKTTSSKAVEDHRTLFPPGVEAVDGMTAIGERARNVTGLAIYDGGMWPLKYNGCHFFAEPTMHLVHEDIVSPIVEGLGYEATRRQEEEFITADATFHPKHLQVGPDGALYILDGGSEGKSAKLWRIQHHYAQKMGAENPATPEELLKRLEHPNKLVRMGASRLIMEQQPQELIPGLSNLLHTARLPYTRLHALWGLYHLGALSESNMIAAVADKHPAVQKNAFRVVLDYPSAADSGLEKALIKVLGKEMDDRSKLRAILAFGKPGLTKEGRGALMKASADFKNLWARSAALGVLKNTPMESLKAAFSSEKADSLKDFVGIIAADIAFSDNKKLAKDIVLMLGAPKGAPGDPLKGAILSSFGQHLSPDFVPEWSEDLGKALKALISSQSHTVRYAALPVAVHWDKEGAIASRIQSAKKEFFADIDSKKLNDDNRSKLVVGLMRIPAWQKDVIPMLDKLLDTKMGEPIQKLLLSELANAEHPSGTAVILRRYPKIAAENRGLALYPLLRRPEGCKALLAQIGQKGFAPQELGAHVLDVLVHYPDPEVSAAAKAVIEKAKASDFTSSSLLARMEEKSDPKKGKEHFQRNCGFCHKVGSDGKEKDIGPDVSFLALRPTDKWLQTVLETAGPSAEAERVCYVTTRDGEILFGTVLRQTVDGLLLRNWQEECEIRTSKISQIQPTNFSLMPESLNVLPVETLRDIAGYIKSAVKKGS